MYKSPYAGMGGIYCRPTLPQLYEPYMKALLASSPKKYRRMSLSMPITSKPCASKNRAASANVLTVSVPEIQLGVPFPTTLSTGQLRLYQVRVPQDKTLRVSLTSAARARSRRNNSVTSRQTITHPLIVPRSSRIGRPVALIHTPACPSGARTYISTWSTSSPWWRPAQSTCQFHASPCQTAA
jgi:hypothetical protein